MEALEAFHLVLKLNNTIVKISKLVLKLSEHCRNTQRTTGEGIKQLFFHSFCLIIGYINSLLLSVTTGYSYSIQFLLLSTLSN